MFKCTNPTNEGTRYENTLTGNRAALCRGLDAYGFASLSFQVNRHVSMTSSYYGTDDEERQFKTGTPKELVHSIERIWDDVAPTPEEFSHDIDGFPMVLDAIIEAKGVSVEDKEIHKGGRRDAMGGYSDASTVQQVKAPQRKRQRKATLKEAHLAIHPDAQAAWDQIKNGWEDE